MSGSAYSALPESTERIYMQKQKTQTTQDTVIDGSKLWDEILKAIVSTMPEQLFPLFKEVYGREYPRGTSVVVLGTEVSGAWEAQNTSPDSVLMDIALLVADRDYYHLECQMKNDHEMVIRMFAYDVRYAITHSRAVDDDTGEITLFFPHSVVIYPEKNNAVPDHLQCRIVFQDGSEHVYKVPTVRIQVYSLEEIREKHLSLFLPYVVLRLRPKLAALTEKRSQSAEEKVKEELTSMTGKIIVMLEDEKKAGYIGEWEYHNYMNLFKRAVERVLAGHPRLRREVDKMTEPLIKLPSQIWEELQQQHKAEIEELKKEYQEERQAEAERYREELERQNKENKAEIARLQALVAELTGGGIQQ